MKSLKYKFNTTDYNNIYFCSDLHLFHDKTFIFEPRGFKSEIENRNMAVSFLQSLKQNDVLICLGDMALSAPVDELEKIMKAVKAKVYYIYGNHESQTSRIFEKNILPNWKVFGETLVEFVIDRQVIIACHYPITSWKHKSHDSWMVHGHVHGNLAGSNLHDLDNKILDVGMDNAIKYNGTPAFSFTELKQIMDNKNNTKIDHH